MRIIFIRNKILCFESNLVSNSCVYVHTYDYVYGDFLKPYMQYMFDERYDGKQFPQLQLGPHSNERVRKDKFWDTSHTSKSLQLEGKFVKSY